MPMRDEVTGRGRCLALTAVVICAACSGRADVNALRSTLVGDYRLVVNSQHADSRLDSGELTLTSDGRSHLRCKYKDGRLSDVSGTWELLTSGPSVLVSPFKDCAGVLTEFHAPGAALLVEMSNPPVLVLDPDIVGVFYEKIP